MKLILEPIFLMQYTPKTSKINEHITILKYCLDK